MHFWLGRFACSLMSVFNFVVWVQVYFMKARSLLGGSLLVRPLSPLSGDGKDHPAGDWGWDRKPQSISYPLPSLPCNFTLNTLPLDILYTTILSLNPLCCISFPLFFGTTAYLFHVFFLPHFLFSCRTPYTAMRPTIGLKKKVGMII